jgi:hypothetical protein
MASAARANPAAHTFNTRQQVDGRTLHQTHIFFYIHCVFVTIELYISNAWHNATSNNNKKLKQGFL